VGAGGTKDHEPSTVTPAGDAVEGYTAAALSPAAALVVHQFHETAAKEPLEGLCDLASHMSGDSDLTPVEAETVKETLAAAIADIATNADTGELVTAASAAGLPIAKVLAESDLASEPALQLALGKYLATHDVDEQLAIHAAMVALCNEEQLAPQWAEAIEHLDGDETWTGPLEEFNQAVASYDALPPTANPLEKLEATNRVWGYIAPADVDGASELVAWAQQKCPTPHLYGSISDSLVDELSSTVGDVDKKWLGVHDAFKVASMATPMSARLALKARAQLAEDTFQTVSMLAPESWSTLPADLDDLPAWVDANATISKALTDPGIQPLKWKVSNAAGATLNIDQVTTGFRVWAKKQKLAELRQVAVGLGLENASSASRAQIQNYLAAHWDPKHQTEDIQDLVTAKAQGTTASNNWGGTAPAAPAGSSSKAQPAKAKMSKTMAATPVGTGSNAFHANVISLATKAATANSLAVDVPAPTPTAVVAGHNWDKHHLGAFSKGSHESHLYNGPDGTSQWLFKPDKSNNGARAHAEAAASQIFAAAGVATVDVHVTKIGKRTGAIQPMVSGAQNLSSQPASWSQADVDQIVANHVVSWAVGDHDGHSANMLRTPSGAIVGIDHGQAFKFTGSDKLSATWKPSSNPTPAVHTQLYGAAKNGGLAAGGTVKASAAIGAIKKLQSIPNSTYASWLQPTATEGVKHNVHWVNAMRKAAQTRHGTKTVTDTQIADEFITTTVERKNNLSSAFAGFFTKQGIADASHISLLAPSRTSAA